MTNLRKLLGFFAISTLLVLLTNCKKDDDKVSTEFSFDENSMHFEWGQTKQVGYTSEHIEKINDPIAPRGWECYFSDGNLVISSPSSVGEGDPTGTIELTATTEVGTIIKKYITVAIMIAEEISSPANSFIVTEPGKRYKFNARRRGYETAETLSKATGAYRVWSTSPTAIDNVSFEDGYIFFATGTIGSGITGDVTIEQGNAVIAVTDKDENVLWSWHIWATDYDPATEYDLAGSVKIMNRNLGAFANSNASEEDVADSYGLYYQWGRKDPFAGPDVWNSSVQRRMVNRNDVPMMYSYEVTTDKIGTVEYAISHPLNFIAGAEKSDYDWHYASRDNNLWSATSKTLYDPCPDGWRVAPPTVWSSFTTTGSSSTDPEEFNVEGDYSYGWTFVAEGAYAPVYYPAAGRRSFSPSLATAIKNYTNIVNDDEGNGSPVGFYWSSLAPSSDAASTAEQYGAASLAFTGVRIDIVGSDLSGNARAGGFPLRCIED